MEITRIKKSIASLAIAGSLFGATIAGVSAAQPSSVQQGGAAGVVAAVVQANNLINNNTLDVTVVQLNNSLNNLTALNNVLNNSPILNNNNILQGITVQNIDVAIANGSFNGPILQNALQNALRNANITIQDVVGVAVLNGGDIILFAR